MTQDQNIVERLREAFARASIPLSTAPRPADEGSKDD
jgi:hypothetical protein